MHRIGTQLLKTRIDIQQERGESVCGLRSITIKSTIIMFSPLGTKGRNGVRIFEDTHWNTAGRTGKLCRRDAK